MAPNDMRNGPEPSVTTLVSGIVKDVQDLTKQQLALFKQEISSEFRKAREIALSWALGLVGLVVGTWMLFLMIVYLLHEKASLELWLSYGIVGVVAAVAGLCLFYAGKKKLDSFSPLPNESVQALKENVQCVTNLR